MRAWFTSLIFTTITSCLVLFANFEYKLGAGSHTASLVIMGIFWGIDFIWLIGILISKAKNNNQQKRHFDILAKHLTQSSEKSHENPMDYEDSADLKDLREYKDSIDEEFNNSIDKAALNLTGEELHDFIDKALKDYVDKKRVVGKIE